MAIAILNNKNISSFIKELKIKPEQEKILLDAVPSMDKKERLELLDLLKDIYFLNTEQEESIKRIEEIMKKKP